MTNYEYIYYILFNICVLKIASSKKNFRTVTMHFSMPQSTLRHLSSNSQNSCFIQGYSSHKPINYMKHKLIYTVSKFIYAYAGGIQK